MKDASLLVWLGQLGLSVVVPPVGFILLAVWLHKEQGWGVWVLWVGVILGVTMAVDGLRSSLKTLKRLTDAKNRDEDPPAVSFNDHE